MAEMSEGPRTAVDKFLGKGHLSTAALKALRAQYTVSGMVPSFGGAYPPELGVARVDGFKLWTPEGLDGPGLYDLNQAILSMSLGWNREEIEAAVRRSEEDFPGVTMVDTTRDFEPFLLLAKALVEALKPYGDFRALLAATGTGANNQAIRLCMGALGGEDNTQLIVFEGAYGGADLFMNAACDATGWVGLTSLQKNALVVKRDGSNLEEVFRAVQASGKKPLLHVEDGQQGVAGFEVISPLVMKNLVKETHNMNGLVILDDVQAFVRNGAGLLGFDRWAAGDDDPALKPDAVTLAKGLGNGRGVAAAMIGEHVLNMVNDEARRTGKPIGTTFDTFNGQTDGLIAGAEVLRTVLREKLWENMRGKGEEFAGKLRDIAGRYGDVVEEVVGEGGLIGARLKTADQVKRAFEAAPGNEIYFAKGGSGSAAGRVLRLPLPFNATDELVAEVSDRLERVFKAAA